MTPIEPLALRWTLYGAALAGIVGGVVGLVVGLLAHPATAWFAVVELGIPAGMVGAFIGLVSGLVVTAVGRINR